MTNRNPSKWRVTANPVGGQMLYAVYRIRDVDEVDHSGNREYWRGGWIESREEAQRYADKMNQGGES